MCQEGVTRNVCVCVKGVRVCVKGMCQEGVSSGCVKRVGVSIGCVMRMGVSREGAL